MATYTFRFPGRDAGKTITVYDAMNTQVASGAADANAVFTASLAYGDYYAVAPDGQYVRGGVDSPQSVESAGLADSFARLKDHQRARLRNVPDSLTVMATPPTITKGAAGGAHAVGAGAVHVQSVDDPRIRIYGGSTLTKAVRYAGPPIAYDNWQVTSTLDRLAPWVHSFMYYGTKFAFRLTETSPAGWYQLYVDGQPVAATPTAQGANTASSFSYTVDFSAAGGAKARHISLEVGYLGFAGVYIEPTAAIWLPSTPKALRSVWLGDSYTVGANSSAGTLFAPEAARLLGWNDCFVSGEAGTGYLNPGSGGSRQKFRDRIAADVQPHNPDVIVVTGSTNDNTYSASAVGTEATALYAEIASRCPGVPVYVVGIQYPNNDGVTTDSTRDPIETAMRAAATAAPNVKGYVSMKGWFSGTGTVAAPIGSGVNDVFMSSDGIHPTSAGHQYMAKRVASGIAGLLTA